MNAQMLLTHARLAAPSVRARLESRNVWKKIVSLFTCEPGLVPVPVHVPAPSACAVRGLAAAALVWSLVALSLPAQAQQDYRRIRPTSWDWNVDGKLVDVSVIVDGSTAPLYLKNGAWDRHYVQAFKGRNYSLVVRNNTGRRVGVLLAVDGLNVVNGQRTQLSNREAMYVLDPYEVATIRGWRTSLAEVRRFVFVDEQRSYASRTDQANGDLGWIRVLAFNESQPIAWRDWDLRRNATDRRDEGGSSEEPRPQGQSQEDAPGLGAKRGTLQPDHAAPESNPGTGWGERRSDPVQQTQFLAERDATDHIVLRYEYASGLAALGIMPRVDRTWQRDRGELGFAPPPRW